jgi:hypothetical protein
VRHFHSAMSQIPASSRARERFALRHGLARPLLIEGTVQLSSSWGPPSSGEAWGLVPGAHIDSLREPWFLILPNYPERRFLTIFSRRRRVGAAVKTGAITHQDQQF